MKINEIQFYFPNYDIKHNMAEKVTKNKISLL